MKNLFVPVLAGLLLRRSLFGALFGLLTLTAQAAVVSATFSSSSSVPVSSDGYITSGNTVDLSLGFTPTPGTSLTVVNNTGTGFITGTFDNLANGATVTLNHGGTSYNFVAWYYGGTGNDLVLLWPTTKLAGWGRASNYRLAIDQAGNVLVPTASDSTGVLDGKTIVQLSRGDAHTVALTTEGKVYSFGNNTNGQLGINSYNSSLIPVEVDTTGALSGKFVVAIATARRTSYALCSDGTVASWGENSSRLGNSTNTTDSKVPVAVTTSGVLSGKTIVSISAGTGHVLALCSDGTPVAWGIGGAGQLGEASSSNRSAPVLISTASGTSALFGKTVIGIAGGSDHSVALCSDGTVVAWGSNSYGQLGDDSITSRNAPVVVNAVSGTSALFGKTVVAVAAGERHSLALCADGSVAAWGRNNLGQLGDNSNTEHHVPVAVSGLTNAVAVAAGDNQTLALTATGALVAWGENVYGQIGDNATTTRTVPTPVNVADGVSALFGKKIISLAGSGSAADHFMALYADAPVVVLPGEIDVQQPSGTDLTSGDAANFGALLSGTTVTETFTILNSGAGDLNNVAVSVDGTNADQFTVLDTPPTVLAPAATTAIRVRFAPSGAGAKTAVLHISSDDADENPFDLTLTGSTSATLSATYGAADDVPATANGLTATGTAINFALNFTPTPGDTLTVVNNTGSGFINGTFTGLANGTTVTLNHGGTNYNFVAWYYGGDGNDLVLLWPTTGLAGWGRASNGRLAVNQAGNVLVPTDADLTGVLAGKTIIQVSRGLSHTLALTSEGKVYAWGNSTQGQLGINSQFGGFAPVAVFTDTGPTALNGKFVIAITSARNTSYALCSDGTIASWGENQRGQLGNGTSGGGTDSADVRVPVAVTMSGVLSGKTVVALAGGTNHVLALCSDGTVAAWGTGGSGQLGDNSTSDRSTPVLVNTASGTSDLFGKTVVAIAGGGNHSLALCSDGTVVAWGSNSNGQLGDNSTISRNAPVAVNTTSGTSALFGKTVTAIAAGNQHSIALNSDGTVSTWGRNNRSQLGDNSQIDSPVPVAVNTASGVSALFGKSVKAIAAGLDGNLALMADGTLAAWGYSLLGQVGDNSTVSPRAVPTAVNVEDGVSALAGKTVISLADSGSAADYFLALYANIPVVVLPGEIDVKNATGTSLTSGTTSNFSSIEVGTAASQIFTILNSGAGNLNNIAVTIDGTDASMFSVTSAPRAGLAASDSTTVTVQFVPLSSGTKSANLHIASSDADENPFTVTLSGEGVILPGEIDVKTAGGTLITSGDTADFVTLLSGTTVTQSFTILNSGPGDLNNVAVTVDGTDADQFTVLDTPPSVLAPTATTIIQVRFAPSGSGTKTAVLHIASDDDDENPFNLTLTGSTTATISANYTTGHEVPITADLITATGNMVNLGLNFAPMPGTTLTVVNNTGQDFINGTFSNIANGAIVNLSYDGINYPFIAWYYGGTGNDLVLLWPETKLAGWGHAANGRLAIDQAGNILVPTAADSTGVLTGKTVVQLARGDSHTLALTSEGRVVAWGDNSSGHLGDNSTTQRTVPVAVNTTSGTSALFGKTVTSIAAGSQHVLALCSDGTIVSWGTGGAGQLGNNSASNRLVPVLVNTTSGTSALFGKTVIEIAGGSDHSVALCSDGTVVAWGSNSFGQLGDDSTTSRNAPVVVNAVSGTSALFGQTVVAVAAGERHSLALCADGSVAAWGRNNLGQLGDNSTTEHHVPVAVDGLTNAVALAAGDNQTLALTATGALVAWGENVYGQIGDNTTDSPRTEPTPVNVAADVSALYFQPISRLAGSGSSADHFMVIHAPVPMPAPEISVEQPTDTALTSGATRDFGALDAGQTTSLTFNIRNSGNRTLDGIALTIEGSDADQFSITNPPQTTVAVDGTTSFTVQFTTTRGGAMSASLRVASNDADENPFNINLTGSASYAVTANYATGNETPFTVASLNASGSSVSFALNYAPSPGTTLNVVNNTGIDFIQSEFTNLANDAPIDLTYDGVTYPFTAWYYGGTGNDLVLLWRHTGLASWGQNNFGQLGDNSNLSRSVPVQVDRSGVLYGKTVVQVVRGAYHAVALCSDGTVAAWGLNQYGKLGINVPESTKSSSSVPVLVDTTNGSALFGKTVIAIAGGEHHTLALCSDGTVASWGYGNSGRLGQGSLTDGIRPVVVDTTSGSALFGKKVVAIAAGGSFSLALCADGTLAAWGDNSSGQLGDNTTTRRTIPFPVDNAGPLSGKTVKSIAGGDAFALALCTDGTLVAWGKGISGQLGNGTYTDSLVPTGVFQGGVLYGKTVTSITAGGYHGMALCSDGSIAAWGRNDYGALGDNTSTGSNLPVLVNRTNAISALAEQSVTSITASAYSNQALTSTGVVAAWGRNNNGQLGDNSTTDRSVPTLVNTTSGVSALASRRVIALAGGGEASGYGIAVYALLPPEVLPGEIDVQQPTGTALTSGASSDFSSIEVGANASLTFTILNSGTGDLNNILATLDGPDASLFSITSSPATTLAPAASTTVTVQFAPLATGAKTATLHIASSDADENPFDITLTGSGVILPGEIDVKLFPSLTQIQTGDTADYGSLLTGTSKSLQFALDNIGAGDLNNLSLTIEGTDADQFILKNGLPSTLAPNNGGALLTIQFNPIGNGSRTATMRIISDDADENPFNVVLTGTTSDTLTANFTNSNDVAVTAAGLDASGKTINFNLSFTPAPGTTLKVVNNTGVGLINGTFNGLANGQTVTLNHGGTDYNFVAWYYGGDGNDLVLLWQTTGLAGWGRAANGRLAVDQAGNILVPTNADLSGVLADKTIVQVARGRAHTLALTSEGKVYAWGDNTTGQLGTNSQFGGFAPVAVFTDTGPTSLNGKFVIAIATARNTSYALCSDGTIAAWGENQRGQLGNGTTGGGTDSADVRVPVSVTMSGVLSGKTVTRIAAGSYHALVLCSDGTVAAWGTGGSGQLGDNSTADRSTPVLVNTTSGTSALFGKTVVAIAGGGNHSLAVSSDNRVYAWGSNEYGQLGDNTTTSRNVPVAVNRDYGTSGMAGYDIQGVAAGVHHSMALSDNRLAFAWGRNNVGQLGNNSTTDSLVPVRLSLSSIVAIAAGENQNLALSSDGVLSAWGQNDNGQIGDNTTTSPRTVPTAVNIVDGTSALSGKTISSLAGSGSAANHFMVLYGNPPPPPRQTGPDFVVTTMDDHDDGVPGIADTTLREAINAANANPDLSIISFDPTALQTSRTINLTSALPTLTGNVEIRGPGGFTVRRDTGGDYRVFTVDYGAVATISGMTISNGEGGISNNGTLTVENCSITNNTASGDGGGIENYGTLTVTRTLVSSNTSGSGGGGIQSWGTLTVTQSTIGSNSATNGGGGIDIGEGSATLSAITIAGNRAPSGGGIRHLGSGLLAITNSTLSLNTTTTSSTSDGGAAIHLNAGYGSGGPGATLDSVTITSNFASNPSGSGLRGIWLTAGTLEMRNTILAGNGSSELQFDGGSINSLGHNLIGLSNVSSSFDQIGDQTDVSDPGLEPLTDNGGTRSTHALKLTSPALNAGSTSLTVDQRGEPRPSGSAADIGAFELYIAPTETAIVELGELSVTYDGNPHAVSVTTTPTGLTTTVTYAGSTTVPTNAGSYAVVATVTGTTHHGSASGTLVIAKAQSNVTWSTPLPVTYGTALSSTQLNAMADVPGVFTYSPLAGTVLDAGLQALGVSFVPTDTTNYIGSTGSQNLLVNRATAIVSLSGLTPTYDGSPQSVGVTTTPSGLSTSVTYDGGITAPTNSGTYPVVATISDANYVGSVSGSLIIAKATPVITWTPASPQSDGYVLDSAVLNASADVAGTLVYTPTAGTALNLGDNTVTVDFTPTDTANYLAADAIRTINVTAVAPAITQDPVGQSVVVGGAISLSVVATGSGPLSYQWRKDTVDLSGQTSSTLSISTATAEDAGSYDVVVTNSVTSVTSAAATVTVSPVQTPTITSEPTDQVVLIGSTASFTVEATGGDSLTYQWRKDTTPITNATAATFEISPSALADAGSYDVVVTNNAGDVTSTSASLTVVDLVASHEVVGSGYTVGGTVTITNTITYAGTLSSLGWTVLPPDPVDDQPWSYASGGGNVAQVSPQSGDTDLFDWAWTTTPASPVVFTYTLNVPANATGEKSLIAMVKPRFNGVQLEALVPPDPLVMTEVPPFHSADTNQDSQFSLTELLRVIELYNTRFGTTRTGRYQVEDGTEDGFSADPSLASSASVTLTRYHAGDTNQDGKFSLTELLRIIELYNFREGTKRTGLYHVQLGTEDGFAPGPEI